MLALVAASKFGGSGSRTGVDDYASKPEAALTTVDTPVGPNTLYILSTSGRLSSMMRYRALLASLELDVAYIVINNGGDGSRRIDPLNFASAVRGLRAVGGAISKDIKGSIAAHLDEVDPEAAAIGAVNTVVRRGDRLVGFNTDAEGFRVAIRAGIEGLDVQTAVCYGYGGVTAVVVSVLRSMGIRRIFITGRRQEAASERAAGLGCELFDPAHGPADLFVNAAPVTDSPLGQAPHFLEALRGCKAAFDHELVGSELNQYCTACVPKMRHIPGKSMYWPQMVAQWRLFLEDRVSAPQLDALLAALQQADRMN
jgi:shikimate 5-dehydrogenase